MGGGGGGGEHISAPRWRAGAVGPKPGATARPPPPTTNVGHYLRRCRHHQKCVGVGAGADTVTCMWYLPPSPPLPSSFASCRMLPPHVVLLGTIPYLRRETRQRGCARQWWWCRWSVVVVCARPRPRACGGGGGGGGGGGRGDRGGGGEEKRSRTLGGWLGLSRGCTPGVGVAGTDSHHEHNPHSLPTGPLSGKGSLLGKTSPLRHVHGCEGEHAAVAPGPGCIARARPRVADAVQAAVLV